MCGQIFIESITKSLDIASIVLDTFCIISCDGVVIMFGVPPFLPDPLTQPLRFNPWSIEKAVLFNPLAFIQSSRSENVAGLEAYCGRGYTFL